MLDKGDLKTLFEKIETVSKKEDSADFLKKIENKSFNFYDFMNQMKSLEKLGSFSSLLKFLPGFQGLKNQVDISSIEQEIQGFKVMIDSMTQQERLSESLLKNPSRIERIARGSGKKTADVLGFYKKFLDTKNMLHQFAPGLKTGNLSPEVQKKMQDSLNKKPKNTQSPYGKKFF
jgi:signal recognition particle subunit SRP54